MARPQKNNADYFPHQNGMRNHRKVKMLRNKFGVVLGYAFWCMMLEWLTEHDGLEWEFSDIEIEMFASELGVSAAEIPPMIEYCIRIELLFKSADDFIYSESLNECLNPVFEKRKIERDKSKTRIRRGNGTYLSMHGGVSAAEMPQSKVKKSKVKVSKETIYLSETSKDVQTDIKISINKWIEGFDKRKEQFRQSLLPFTRYNNNPEGVYSAQMIKDFFEYWYEPNKSKSKMKWECEKTWDLNLRLIRWANNPLNTKNKNYNNLKVVDQSDNKNLFKVG